MRRAAWTPLVLALLALPGPVAADDRARPEEVWYPAGDLKLRGFLYRPKGPGPFPVMIWNHGSERGLSKDGRPNTRPQLGALYTAAGYVLFLPFRHGQGGSPGEYHVDAMERIRREEPDPAEADRKVTALHDLYLKDVLAAVEYVKTLPYADRSRVAMSGASFGGIQTILAAEKATDVRAFVPFAAAAMSWRGSPALRERLGEAVRRSQAPMFFVQAENDYDLGPVRVLGAELERKGGLHKARIYPPIGDKTVGAAGHALGVSAEGIALWKDDVFAFLDEAMKR
jgi:carboxymethylenebutenolidase